jgi:hypothetical protein
VVSLNCASDQISAITWTSPQGQVIAMPEVDEYDVYSNNTIIKHRISLERLSASGTVVGTSTFYLFNAQKEFKIVNHPFDSNGLRFLMIKGAFIGVVSNDYLLNTWQSVDYNSSTGKWLPNPFAALQCTNPGWSTLETVPSNVASYRIKQQYGAEQYFPEVTQAAGYSYDTVYPLLTNVNSGRPFPSTYNPTPWEQNSHYIQSHLREPPKLGAYSLIAKKNGVVCGYAAFASSPVINTVCLTKNSNYIKRTNFCSPLNQCPPNTCDVLCGNTICCYGADGISVFNYPNT